MLYEVRLYDIPVGRIADVEQRMLVDVPPLFEEHGMRTVGHWTVVAGPNLPAFLYVLEWRDAAEREARWLEFYADERWWGIRQRTNGGSELVEKYGLWLMKLNPARPEPFGFHGCVRDGEIHELVLHEVAIGQSAELARHLHDVVLPSLVLAGGEILAALDMLAGPAVPSLAVFVKWPDFATRRKGRCRLEQLRSARSDEGTPLLGRSDVYLLQPMSPAIVESSR